MNAPSEQSMLTSPANVTGTKRISSVEEIICDVPLPNNDNSRIMEKSITKHDIIGIEKVKTDDNKDDDSINLEDLFPLQMTEFSANAHSVVSDVEDNRDEAEGNDQSIELQVDEDSGTNNKPVMYAMNSSMNLNCSFRRPAMDIITQSAPEQSDFAKNCNASDKELFAMSNSQLSFGSANTDINSQRASVLTTLHECSGSSTSGTVRSGAVISDENGYDSRSMDLDTLMTDGSNVNNSKLGDSRLTESYYCSTMVEGSFTHSINEEDETENNTIVIECRRPEGTNRCYLQYDSVVQERTIPEACVGIELSTMAFFESLVTRSGACLDQIVRSMKQFPGCDAACQGWVCSALAKWARNAHHRKIIVENGGFDIIRRAMTRHPEDASVQIEACKALGNLCNECKENANALYKLGLVTKILQAMQRCYAIADVYSKGCYALTMIFQNPSTVELVAERDGIELILRGMQLHTEDVTVQMLGCAALWYLIPFCANELNNVVMSTLDFAMGGHPNQASVQKYALAVLVKCLHANTMLMQDYGIDLIDAIAYCVEKHRDEPSIVENGCALLSKIFNHEKENVFAVVSSLDLLPLFIESIRKHCSYPQVLEQILSILSKLAKRKAMATFIVQTRGVASIVAAMMANTTHGGIQYEGCQSLLNMSRNVGLQKTIGNEGGVYAVVDSMRFHPEDEGIQAFGVACLTNLMNVHENVEMLLMADAKSVLEDVEHTDKRLFKKVELITAAISKIEDSGIGKRAKPKRRTTSRNDPFVQNRMRDPLQTSRRRSLFGSIGCMFDKEDDQEIYHHHSLRKKWQQRK